jgi:DNA-directed RNA polymerase specialized sigma24 family protein
MATLELSSERLFLLRGIIHQAINTKERAARDNRNYAEIELKREQADPHRQATLTSQAIFTIADSLDECVVGLKEIFHDITEAMDREAAAEQALIVEMAGPPDSHIQIEVA